MPRRYKVRRYVREYGQAKIRDFEHIAKDSPRLEEDCRKSIERINAAIKAYEQFMVNDDEAILAILEA